MVIVVVVADPIAWNGATNALYEFFVAGVGLGLGLVVVGVLFVLGVVVFVLYVFLLALVSAGAVVVVRVDCLARAVVVFVVFDLYLFVSLSVISVICVVGASLYCPASLSVSIRMLVVFGIVVQGLAVILGVVVGGGGDLYFWALSSTSVSFNVDGIVVVFCGLLSSLLSSPSALFSIDGTSRCAISHI